MTCLFPIDNILLCQVWPSKPDREMDKVGHFTRKVQSKSISFNLGLDG